MVEIRRLDPHDSLPEGQGHRVVVLRRFDEDDPRRTVTEITLTSAPGRPEVARPMQADGTAMPLEDVVAAARRVAETETEGIHEVFVLDRTAGQLEHDVIEHAGDHSFAGKKLDDSDFEDDERGADMRDRRP